MSRENDAASLSWSMKIMLLVVVFWAWRWWQTERWLITYVGIVALVALVVFLVGWSDWARTRRSPSRWRCLLCLYVGHRLGGTGRDPRADVPCARCGRVFQAMRWCPTCHQCTNREET